MGHGGQLGPALGGGKKGQKERKKVPLILIGTGNEVVCMTCIIIRG